MTWIDVKDKLPKIETYCKYLIGKSDQVLVLTDSEEVYVSKLIHCKEMDMEHGFRKEAFRWDPKPQDSMMDNGIPGVTHWMQVPELPNSKKNKIEYKVEHKKGKSKKGKK